MIEIIGTKFYQWDTGRSVLVKDSEADHVHFANKGDSKAVIVEIADSQAKIPDYLFQTGKQLCAYAVKNGVTLESCIFYIAPRERPENYVYDEDQRNYIYELIRKAETAIEGASSAYEDAHIATEAANTAVASANIAVEKANKSADSASLAAKNANEAADKANHAAKSLMVVGSAEGDSITLDDAIDQFLVGMRIFGKTTQDGTPTPDAPVELESVGDRGGIIVNVVGDNVAQSMTVATPNGLPGIPVTSGGNYIDSNGQQWICDEIDFNRGVYVRRIDTIVFVGSEDEWATYNTEENRSFYIDVSNAALGMYLSVCSHFKNVDNSWGSGHSKEYGIYSDHSSMKRKYFRPPNEATKTIENWRAWLAENPTTLIYVLATPIETPLTEEELAAYAALHTYRGNTTVSNDASAHMEIEYVMDAKKYIDSQIHPAAKLSSVKLLASKWTGSDNLYSQVVSIPGITENSQVNLAPSVEQLAIFYDKDITFVTENDGGVVTIYVIGQKPQNDYTIQADIVEVIV